MGTLAFLLSNPLLFLPGGNSKVAVVNMSLGSQLGPALADLGWRLAPVLVLSRGKGCALAVWGGFICMCGSWLAGTCLSAASKLAWAYSHSMYPKGQKKHGWL